MLVVSNLWITDKLYIQLRRAGRFLPALPFSFIPMMIKRFLPFFLIAISTAFVACTGCKSDKDAANQMTEFEQKLTSKDTADVEKVIAQFYSNIKDKKYYDAAAMLYTRKQKDAAIRQLTNEEMVKFLTETENEVSCTIILRKGEQGMPDATTKMFFTPVLFGGQWCLILTDSKHLESPISNFYQRDSLKQRYDNYKKTTKKK